MYAVLVLQAHGGRTVIIFSPELALCTKAQTALILVCDDVTSGGSVYSFANNF